jgi:hypothetical protein
LTSLNSQRLWSDVLSEVMKTSLIYVPISSFQCWLSREVLPVISGWTFVTKIVIIVFLESLKFFLLSFT